MSIPMLHMALLILARALLALIRGQDGKNWEPQLEGLIREIGRGDDAVTAPLICPVCGCVAAGERVCGDCSACLQCGSNRGADCPCWR